MYMLLLATTLQSLYLKMLSTGHPFLSGRCTCGAGFQLTFAGSNIKKIILGESFTNPLTTKSDGAISYKSSNPKVAIIDSSGQVTVMDFGTTTMTATIVEGSNFNSAKYNVFFNCRESRLNN